MTFELPQEHKEAIGLAYYDALGSKLPWDRISITGSLLSLLATAAEANDDKVAERLIAMQFFEWGRAMREYSTPAETEEKQLHAMWSCQIVLGMIGTLAYKYGKIPSGGFKILDTVSKPTEGSTQ